MTSPATIGAALAELYLAAHRVVANPGEENAVERLGRALRELEEQAKRFHERAAKTVGEGT